MPSHAFKGTLTEYGSEDHYIKLTQSNDNDSRKHTSWNSSVWNYIFDEE